MNYWSKTAKISRMENKNIEKVENYENTHKQYWYKTLEYRCTLQYRWKGWITETAENYGH